MSVLTAVHNLLDYPEFDTDKAMRPVLTGGLFIVVWRRFTDAPHFDEAHDLLSRAIEEELTC